MHPSEARYLAEPDREALLIEPYATTEMFSALPPGGFDRRIYAVLPAPATRLIEDGDTLDFGDRHFEVIYTPGHSPGSIALWETASGVLFSGDRHYVYFWADGIRVQARLEDDAQCLLVIIGATPEGKKELVGLIDGVRESAQSWRELLLDLKRRGLAVAPELAIADGALGFWKAIEEVWPRTRSQRCWVHKTANVLNKLPKSQHSKAKRALQEIWMAETRNDADSAFDAFIETCAVKYDKAAACLVKDRETMLAFYDFPAEHWKHLRTTNPIESTFATVRHRTVRSKGCLSNKTALAMVFKLAQAAQNSWRRLDGHNQLPKLIVGVKFIDGIEAVRQQPQAAA